MFERLRTWWQTPRPWEDPVGDAPSAGRAPDARPDEVPSPIACGFDGRPLPASINGAGIEGAGLGGGHCGHG
jgi:hypothetical protein